jgi:hypothetical protein
VLRGSGYLKIDNNAAEREVKKIAIGRENRLVYGERKGWPDSGGAVKPGIELPASST